MPSKDSDQTAQLRSLIWIFTGHILYSQGCKVSSCGEWRLIIWTTKTDQMGRCAGNLSLHGMYMSEGMVPLFVALISILLKEVGDKMLFLLWFRLVLLSTLASVWVSHLHIISQLIDLYIHSLTFTLLYIKIDDILKYFIPPTVPSPTK